MQHKCNLPATKLGDPFLYFGNIVDSKLTGLRHNFWNEEIKNQKISGKKDQFWIIFS
jgi:hypothetical protein